MIKVGIVCEYNPFHNGHLYQIRKVREMFGDNCAIIAVMSGNFVQRGQGAIMDKWSRTRAAIEAGKVNVVIELPAIYQVASAQYFADGALGILDATGVCDYLVFGAETDDLSALEKISSILAFEPDEYKKIFKEYIDTGCSYPVAVQKSLGKYDSSLNASSILNGSNNILAIEYLKAIKQRKIKKIKPVVILRKGQNYLDDSIPQTKEFWSASAIRKFVEKNHSDIEKIIRQLSIAMPTRSLSILLEQIHKSNALTSQEEFSSTILSHILALSDEDILSLPGMGEGLGIRLKQAARKVLDTKSAVSQIVIQASTKRFPKSRVNRAITQLLLGIKQKDLEVLKSQKGPFYLRVLGFDKKGQYVLKLMRKKSKLPIIMNASDFYTLPKDEYFDMATRVSKIDLSSTDIYYLHTNRGAGADFTTPPIQVRK